MAPHRITSLETRDVRFPLYGGDTHKEFIVETTGNGAIIFDYDNDGWPDIFLPNGSTVEGFARDKDKAPTDTGDKAGASATTTMTAISICSSRIGDRMCCIATIGTGRLAT